MSADKQSEWGRVAEDGTVFVRTSEGERSVGQVPDVSADEALKFFTDRYDALAFEVQLLEQRVAAGKLSPEEATGVVKQLREQVVEANAVGDLVGLAARLDALAPIIAVQREARRAERAERVAEAKEAKEKIVAEAERLAESNDWRNGANRLRDLLDQWKAVPRLDKASDDALWRRFSSARTAYTRRRKAHFADEHQRRDAARVIKERLATEAESIADSTDWGATAGRYRDLMREWKAAGPAPRDVDDKLWARFRGAQDAFFGARDAANAEQDREFAANAEVKEAILVEAEALLPITDVDAARAAWRDLAERWDAAGKVPRSQMRTLEGRIRKVEDAIRDAGDAQWNSSNPEVRARASDTVAQLERSIADMRTDLEKAKAAGKDKRVRDLEESIAARTTWLEQAQKALTDLS